MIFKPNYQTIDMLNEELFDDPKDAEIARLKRCIEDFKKYDKQRSAYYASKLERLKELEDVCKHGDKAKVLKLKEQVTHLNDIIRARGIEDKRSGEELAEIIKADNLTDTNKRLREENIRLHRTISELIAKLTKYGEQ